ncbi:hypothetical protein OAN93_01070 [Candidatus Marinimicrobia bacterium]|nr:hypothetical protein [Candidatus Neomarinimicrobiota bacterium]
MIFVGYFLMFLFFGSILMFTLEALGIITISDFDDSPQAQEKRNAKSDKFIKWLIIINVILLIIAFLVS